MGIIFLIFIFALKIYFYIKMKITGITSIDLDKYYSEHDLKQHLRGYSRWSNILRNANAGGNFQAL